jgi:hypothetical protein
MGTFMKDTDFDGMTIDDLWGLHLAISKTLSERIIAQKNLLERRLWALEPAARAYPDHVYPYPACLKKFVHS